jgi:hypothetical protein
METLPGELLGEILPNAAEYAPVLSRVCRGWLPAAACLPARQTRKYGLSFLAENGHTSLILWVREARPGSRDFMQPQIDAMYAAACRGGHTALVNLLHGWGVNEPREAFVEAARAGHIGLVLQLWRQGGQSARSVARATCKAARAGHYGLVVTMSEWSGGSDLWAATRMNDILRKAARGGHLDIMRWARCAGAKDFSLAVSEAARGGRVAALELLWSWGGMDTEVLQDAARGGHREVVELLWDRGARNVLGLLEGAAQGGHEELCRFARAKGARPSSRLFYDVAHRGHLRILTMLREWMLEDAREESGNPDEEFDELLLSEALTGALDEGHLEVARLLRSWGGECDAADVKDAFSGAAHAGDIAMLRWLRAEFESGEHYGYANERSLQGALCEAASSGEEDAMRVLRAWLVAREGIKDEAYLDGALYRAADNNQVRAMRLLRLWGAGTRADALETALDLAHASRNNEAAKLLWSWGARLTHLDSDVETYIEKALGGVPSADSSALLAAGIEELLEAFAEPRV